MGICLAIARFPCSLLCLPSTALYRSVIVALSLIFILIFISDPMVVRAAAVLRMLHIERLRRLQVCLVSIVSLIGSIPISLWLAFGPSSSPRVSCHFTTTHAHAHTISLSLSLSLSRCVCLSCTASFFFYLSFIPFSGVKTPGSSLSVVGDTTHSSLNKTDQHAADINTGPIPLLNPKYLDLVPGHNNCAFPRPKYSINSSAVSVFSVYSLTFPIAYFHTQHTGFDFFHLPS